MRYDINSDKWASIAKMSHKRVSPMSAIIHGKIYVFGGYAGSHRPS